MSTESWGPVNKRITFLERRTDSEVEKFRTHWQTTHAQIAVDLPRVVSYRQNHDVADRLIVDEPTFLSGLTGSAYLSGGPTPEWPEKLWLLAQRGDAASEEGIADWMAVAAAEIGAIGVQANRCAPGAPVLKREALRFEPELPEFAIAFGCFGIDEVMWTRMSAMVDQAVSDGLLVRAQLFQAEEIRIV